MKQICWIWFVLLIVLLSACRVGQDSTGYFNNDQECNSNVCVLGVKEISGARIYVKVGKTEKFLTRFISNNDEYFNGKRRFNEFYFNKDVYLLSYCLFCHEGVLNQVKEYDVGGCFSSELVVQRKRYNLSRFANNNDRFLVMLMKSSYYNERHSSLHGTILLDVDNDSYVKVAIPYCE